MATHAHGPKPRDPDTKDQATRMDIEYAIANGLTNAEIMAKFDVPYFMIRRVKDNMLTNDGKRMRLWSDAECNTLPQTAS
jgi:formyltetrahydrofolate hydrolase